MCSKNWQDTTRKRKAEVGKDEEAMITIMGVGQCNFPCAMGDCLPSLQCLDYVFSRKLKLPVAESLASFFCSSDKYFYNWNNHDAL